MQPPWVRIVSELHGPMNELFEDQWDEACRLIHDRDAEIATLQAEIRAAQAERDAAVRERDENREHAERWMRQSHHFLDLGNQHLIRAEAAEAENARLAAQVELMRSMRNTGGGEEC